MKQVYVHNFNQYQLIEAQQPQLQSSHDIIVKVRATTVCGSDVHLLEGHMHTPWGFALGHEFVGVVHAVGDNVQNFQVGERVVAPAAPWCNQCAQCKRGQIQVCERGGIFGSGERFGNLGGAQSEYVRIPYADSCVVKIPDQVTNMQALTVGDILATGWSAVKNAVQQVGQSLVVFGTGPIGLSAVHTARLAGVSQVIAIDTLQDRLDLAKQLGADYTINPLQEDVTQRVLELTQNRGAEAIVDAVGVPNTIHAWAGVAAVGAKVAMVGIPSQPIALDFAHLLHKNISIWTGLGDLRCMQMLMDMIATGVLDPSPIFTEQVPFQQIEKTIAEFIAKKPGLVKPFIELSGG